MNRTSISSLAARVCVTLAASSAAVAMAQEGGVAGLDPLQEIVVTGTRIVRDGFEAPIPVTVLNAENLSATAPMAVPDALNQLPIFVGSRTPQTSGRQNNAVNSGNYLNLRNLGTNRVLILQDGMRVPPTGNNGGTDANLIPQMLIDRVEVVTSGVSAVYGSDGVAGAVNFIMDNEFEGLKGTAQGGESSYDDYEHYRFGLAGGAALMDKRLRLIGSAEKYHNDGIPNGLDRPGTGQFWYFGGAGTAASPIRDYDNVHYTHTSYGGLALSGPFAGQQFMPDGSLAAFNRGQQLDIPAGLAQNSEGADLCPDCTLIHEADTQQYFGRASFEFSDDLSVFVQATHNEATQFANILNPLKFGAGPFATTIFAENAYLRPEVRAALGSAPSFLVSRVFDEWGHTPSEQKTRNTIITAGLEGSFGETWKWGAHYTDSNSKFSSWIREIYNPHYHAAVDAVINPSNGQIVCRITLTNPGLQDDCVPLNILGVGAASRAAIDYVLQRQSWSVENDMKIAGVNLAGEPFSTWAGPVSIAGGAEHRKQSILQFSNSDPATPPDTTGIRAPQAGWFVLNQVGVADGEYTVKEAYVEIVVPLAANLTFVKTLDINGAYRRTDYSTSGGVNTWKVGLNYAPVEDIRFRGTYSRDIRAPSLFELFAGRSIVQGTITDPLTGVNGITIQHRGGNADLKPEIADTYSYGIVLQPRFFDGFSASIDYYNIDIEGAIGNPYTAVQLVQLCHASGGTGPTCAFVHRPLGNQTDPSPANFPHRIDVISQNVGALSTEGVDLELSYRFALGSGAITTRALGSYLISFKQAASSEAVLREYAGNNDLIPLPQWRANLDVAYSNGPLSFSVQERYIGGFNKSDQVVFVDNTIPGVFYTDVSGSYDFQYGKTAKLQLFVTVNNLFDKWAPFSGAYPACCTGLEPPVQRDVHDIIGRYVTAGVKASF